MATQIQQAERFLALHHQPQPLLLPNPWDLGSAKLLAWLGFSALATTSSGFAATVGRLDGEVTRDEAIDHAAAVVRATDLPVSADLENGFSDTAAGVRRVSVGGSFAFAALGAMVQAATELREQGTYGYASLAAVGRAAAMEAFK